MRPFLPNVSIALTLLLSVSATELGAQTARYATCTLPADRPFRSIHISARSLGTSPSVLPFPSLYSGAALSLSTKIGTLIRVPVIICRKCTAMLSQIGTAPIVLLLDWHSPRLFSAGPPLC